MAEPNNPQRDRPVAVTMPDWLWGRVQIVLFHQINMLDEMMKNPNMVLLRDVHQEMYDEAWTAHEAIDAARKEQAGE